MQNTETQPAKPKKRRQNKKARRSNVAAFGQGAGKDRMRDNRMQYGNRWNLRTFLLHVGKIAHELHVDIPSELKQAVGAGAAALFAKYYAIALRDNSEDPQIYCPHCKRHHTVQVSAPCPIHEDSPELQIKVDNVGLEKNSISVALKMLDKMLPTLASVSANVNVQGQITTVSAEICKIIFEFVPTNRRKECFERVDSLFRELEEEENKAA